MMDYPVLACFSLEIFNGDFDEDLKTKTKISVCRYLFPNKFGLLCAVLTNLYCSCWRFLYRQENEKTVTVQSRKCKKPKMWEK